MFLPFCSLVFFFGFSFLLLLLFFSFSLSLSIPCSVFTFFPLPLLYLLTILLFSYISISNLTPFPYYSTRHVIPLFFPISSSVLTFFPLSLLLIFPLLFLSLIFCQSNFISYLFYSLSTALCSLFCSSLLHPSPSPRWPPPSRGQIFSKAVISAARWMSHSPVLILWTWF